MKGDAKIQKAEEKVMRLGDQYNAACEELKELRAKKQAIENDALIKAFLKSDRTFDEAMAYFAERTQLFIGKSLIQIWRKNIGT